MESIPQCGSDLHCLIDGNEFGLIGSQKIEHIKAETLMSTEQYFDSKYRSKNATLEVKCGLTRQPDIK